MISNELRRAIEESGQTAYALAKKAGVDPSAVKKFMVRERGLSLDTFDPLAEALNLVLVKRGESPLPADFEHIVARAAGTLAVKIFHQMARQGEEELKNLIRLSAEDHAKSHGAE
jgi:transcriptional regulator with XRE-family HTH domain